MQIQTSIFMKQTSFLISTILFGLFFQSCMFPPERQQVETCEVIKTKKAIDKPEVNTIHAKIKIAAGLLELDSNTDKLAEAEFEYNVKKWKPEITYTEEAETGNLRIDQPNLKSTSLGGNVKNNWIISLSKDVLFENFDIEFGAGSAELDLEMLKIKNLDLKLGAGEVKTNLANSNTLEYLEVEMGIGDATIDLSGITSVLRAEIEGGIGQITLILPEETGVKVLAQKGIGTINFSGLTKNGNIYTNEACKTSEKIIKIDIQTGLGEVNLKVR